MALAIYCSGAVLNMQLCIKGLHLAGRAVGLIAAAVRLIPYVTSLLDLTARSWRSVLLLMPDVLYMAPSSDRACYADTGNVL